MRYIDAAIRQGYAADCATAGQSYADLVRTWNPIYGDPPTVAELSPHFDSEPDPQKKVGFFKRFFLGAL